MRVAVAVPSLAVFVVLILGGIGLVPGRAEAPPESESESKAGEALYLHCFRATYGQRVVQDPANDHGEDRLTPPERVVSLKVTPGQPFEVIYSIMHRVSGRVGLEGEACAVSLEGVYRSGFAFEGRVDLDVVFDPEITFFSGAIAPVRCVLSRRREIEPFLEAQAELDAEALREATETTRRNSATKTNPAADQAD